MRADTDQRECVGVQRMEIRQNLYGETMNQPTLKFDMPHLSPQCQKLYDRLLNGPITNAAIRDELRLLEYRRRFADLREKGIRTKKTPLGKGLVEYRLET